MSSTLTSRGLTFVRTRHAAESVDRDAAFIDSDVAVGADVGVAVP
ncbi:hypothetical protein I546_3834 [Mycobacterium kansasii 732]|nr:hypothetical protein I546_3834 [Mycobacterium kansasii 732]